MSTQSVVAHRVEDPAIDGTCVAQPAGQRGVWRGRPALVAVAGGLLAVLLAPVRSPAAAPGSALPFDFNGDGYAELAVGAPGESVGTRVEAGQVHVLRGSPAGPTAAGDRVWHQSRRRVADSAQKGDRFGAAIASGDFDRDGYADLAVGVPGESFGTKAHVGAVHVIYGSRTGLTASRDRLWHQGSAGIPGPNERDDLFGSSLAVGDFDGDGFADLAIGVQGESIGTVASAGRVVVLHGSASGLSAVRTQSWSEDTPGIADEPENVQPWTGELLGHSLAAGDLDGDGRDDLAIGAPRGDGLGAVHVLLGSAAGLTTNGSQYLSAEWVAGSELQLPADGLGLAMAIADFNADGRGDLALGLPTAYRLGQAPEARASGLVLTLYSGPGGVLTRPASSGVGNPGVTGRAPDYFGSALTTGDVNGDAVADLAVGAPLAWVADQYWAGAVYMVLGSPAGLVGPLNALSQDTAGVPDAAESGDRLGSSLAAVRLSGGAIDWIVAGAGAEDVGAISDAGAVIAVPGSTSGLVPERSQWWTQSSPGVRGTAEHADRFGIVNGNGPNLATG